MRVEQHGLGVDLTKVDEVQAERDMLLDRIISDERGDDLVGRSSTAMLIAAMSGGKPAAQPHDVYDLNRCERTYERAPAHLQAAMLPILVRFRKQVLALPMEWHREAVEKSYRPAATPELSSERDPGDT